MKTISLKFKSVAILFLLVLVSTGTFAQEKKQDSLPSIWELAKYDGLSAFKGMTNTYTRPLHWEQEDYLTAGAVALGAGALFLLDEPSHEWFMHQEEDIPGIVKDVGWVLGKPQYNYSINGAVYLYGLISRNEKVRKTGVILISAASTAGFIQSLSKTVVGRARPMTGEGKASFDPFSSEAEYHSFPSGHAILAFTTAYAIGKQVENPYIKAGIYGLGLVTPISRLWVGAHWLSDVGLGIAISVITVDAIDNYLNQKRDYGSKDPNKNKISWNFNVGIGIVGIRGTF